jgi:hypothetical protein
MMNKETARAIEMTSNIMLASSNEQIRILMTTIENIERENRELRLKIARRERSIKNAQERFMALFDPEPDFVDK